MDIVPQHYNISSYLMLSTPWTWTLRTLIWQNICLHPRSWYSFLSLIPGLCSRMGIFRFYIHSSFYCLGDKGKRKCYKGSIADYWMGEKSKESITCKNCLWKSKVMLPVTNSHSWPYVGLRALPMNQPDLCKSLMYASGEKDMLSISDHMLNFPLPSLFILTEKRKEVLE